MPSIAHLLLGGMVGYALYIISDKKFSKYHVMIFVLANYPGPDIGWVLGIGYFTHAYAGFFLFASILAFIYAYFTRFSPDFKNRELVDGGYNRVPYASAFLITSAGGLMHIYLDGVMNHQGVFHLFPALGSLDEFVFSINDFFNFWYDPQVTGAPVFALIAGMAFVMGFIVFFLYLLKNMDSRFALKVGAFMGAFMVLYFIFGNFTTLHAEGGAILYVTLFWVTPFGLCALAMKLPAPSAPPAKRGRLKQKFVPTLLGSSIFIGVLSLVIGVAVLVLVDEITPSIVGLWAPLAPHETPLHAFFVLLGIVFTALGCWNLFKFVYYKKRKDANVNLVVVTSLSSVGGFLCLMLGGFFVITSGAIVDIIFSMYDASEIITPEALQLFIAALGVAFVILSGFQFFAGIGVLVENKKVTRFAFLMNAILAWTIVGLYACCLLSQEEVTARIDGTVVNDLESR
ncbi:MAG: hypothetical protein ACTSUE_00700 [Promethearchaeota archaeon]